MFPTDVFVIRDYLLLMICYGQVWMILLPHNGFTQVDEKLEIGRRLTEVDNKKKLQKWGSERKTNGVTFNRNIILFNQF